MSLDVYLKSPNPVAKQGTGIFMRIDGATRELTLEQAREYFPDANVELQQYEGDTLYHANITSNLRQMATAVQCRKNSGAKLDGRAIAAGQR